MHEDGKGKRRRSHYGLVVVVQQSGIQKLTISRQQQARLPGPKNSAAAPRLPFTTRRAANR
jgi:hypothetical protein